MTNQVFKGVWLSDRPLDCNEGAQGDTILKVEFPTGTDLYFYEWIEKDKPYREWLIPATVINSNAATEIFDGEV